MKNTATVPCPAWLPMMVPIGTLISLTASVSQLNGAGRRDEIGPLFRQALWLALALGLLMFAFLSLIPHALAPFGIDADIIPGATAFCHAVRWGAPALVLGFCMRYVSEGMHWTLPTMVFGFGAPVVLAPLGYALAFGFAERIEAAILTHFGINTLHFLLFTYPSIEGGRT